MESDIIITFVTDERNIDGFNPEEYNLGKDFLLTKFAELIGWGCKVPQVVLSKLLSGTFNMASTSSHGLGNFIQLLSNFFNQLWTNHLFCGHV